MMLPQPGSQQHRANGVPLALLMCRDSAVESRPVLFSIVFPFLFLFSYNFSTGLIAEVFKDRRSDANSATLFAHELGHNLGML